MISASAVSHYRGRQTDSQVHRHKGTQTDRACKDQNPRRQAQRQTDKQANKKADRYTNKISWQQDKHAKLYAFRTKHIKG